MGYGWSLKQLRDYTYLEMIFQVTAFGKVSSLSIFFWNTLTTDLCKNVKRMLPYHTPHRIFTILLHNPTGLVRRPI